MSQAPDRALYALFYRAKQGYRHIFALLSGALPLIGGIVLVSGLIVLPLWYLASYHRRLFTIIVLALLAVAVLFALYRRVRRGGRAGVGRLGLGVATLALLYGTVRFFALSLYAAAIPTLLLTIFFTGLLGSPKHRV